MSQERFKMAERTEQNVNLENFQVKYRPKQNWPSAGHPKIASGAFRLLFDFFWLPFDI